MCKLNFLYSKSLLTPIPYKQGYWFLHAFTSIMRITYTKDPLKKDRPISKGKVEPPLFYSRERWSSLMLHFRSLLLPQRSGGQLMRRSKVMPFSCCTNTSSVSPVPTLPLHHHRGGTGERLAAWQPYSLGPSLLLTHSTRLWHLSSFPL